MASFALADFATPARRYFAKGLADDLDRLERLLVSQEGAVRRAFVEFVRSTTSDETVKAVLTFIEAGDIPGALNLIDSHANRFGAVIPRLYQQAALSEIANLAPQIAAIRPTVGISFDPTNPRAAAIMRANGLNFVREFTNEQKMATREALADAVGNGMDLARAERAYRDSMGLTRYQLKIVESYREALVKGEAAALDRALRDRRYDSATRAAVDGRKPLTAPQIDTMVERYRQRLLAFRAKTIATTEARQVLSEGQQEAFEQTMAQAGLGAADTEQTWNTTMDGRERESHAAMDLQVQPWGQAFISGAGASLRYPGDPLAPAEEIINCRCHRTFRIKPPGERPIDAA